MLIESIYPILPSIISLSAVPFIIYFGSKPNIRELCTFVAAGLQLMILCLMAPHVLDGGSYQFTIAQVLPELGLSFKVDSMGLLFAFVAGILWIPTSIYSIGYMRPLKEHAQTRYFACFAAALSATMGVAFSENLLTMYLFYEVLSLSTYLLVAHHQDSNARTGSRKYLTYLMTTSIGFALPAMIITFQTTDTLTFSSLGIFSGAPYELLVVLLLLFVFGFAKAGIMPFHSWLPGAMVAPTPVSSLLHAVAVVKVGVFCILRILTGVFGIQLLQTLSLNIIICVIAGFTVIVSSLIALSQDNLKRRLAFSTIGQLSYIILGAGLAFSVGVAGSLLHIVMHAFGKITLFFCAGAIYVATGEKYISKMVGIGRQMPLTMLAFFIGSLSVIGIPPAGGFLSKWLMLNGALDSGMTWVVGIYLVSSLLNAAYFFPIVYQAFFASDKQSQYPNKVKEAPLWALVPPLITATLVICLFIWPNFFLTLASLAAGVQ